MTHKASTCDIAFLRSRIKNIQLNQQFGKVWNNSLIEHFFLRQSRDGSEDGKQNAQGAQTYERLEADELPVAAENAAASHQEQGKPYYIILMTIFNRLKLKWYKGLFT